MITDLEFFFIQAHEHTIIQPSEGVTVIKGPSHTAKSSLVRSLKWLFLNKMVKGLKSHFAKDNDEMSVGVNFKEDTFVVRRKNKDENAYDTPDGILDAVGSDVPQEVQDITNMSEINIQSQHDGYFMLNESPGNVGRELNKIVGLDIINESFKKCDQLIRTAISDLAYCEQSIKEKKVELTSFDGIDKVEALVNEIAGLITKHDNLDSETRELSLLIEDIKKEQTILDDLNDFLLVVPKYTELSKMVIDYGAKEEELKKLKDLITDIENEQETLSSLKECLTIIPKYKDLENLIRQYKELESLNGSLDQLCNIINSEQNTLKTAQHTLESNRKAYDQFIKEQKICPLCGNKLKQ